MKHTYHIFLTIALSILCFASGILLVKYSVDTAIATRIASEVVRLHVIANSDSAEDQAVKLQVKEALTQALEEVSITSKEEMVSYVSSHLEELNQLAKNTLLSNAFSYATSCELTTSYFPQKTYGDLTFPPGDYLALRVVLGEGAGKNWWCVLYPPLCFIDITTGVVSDESKDALAEVLDDADYDALTQKPTLFRFRLWEQLKEWF